MPTELHKQIRFHQAEIALLKRAIARLEAGAGTEKARVLEGHRENLRVHEEALAKLERQIAQGT